MKVSDKVMIPQEEHPDINFVGLLIGLRLPHDYHRVDKKIKIHDDDDEEKPSY